MFNFSFFYRLYSKKTNRVKVPTVLQMEAAECGAASLAMILAYYDLWIPLEKLRIACGVSRDGSKASNVMRAAQNYGMDARGFRWDAEAIKNEADYPLIIFWEFKHFLVLEGIKGNTVYLNDPAIGRRSVLWSEFLTSYTGIAISVKPGFNFTPSEKRYNIKLSLKEKIKQDKAGILFLIAIGLCLIAPKLSTPVITQVYIDDILTGNHRDWMPNLGLVMALTCALLTILTWLRLKYLANWQRKLVLKDSSDFFRHLLKLPIYFYYQRYIREVVGRISLNEKIAGVLSGNVGILLIDAGIAISFLFFLLQYNVFLTIIGIGLMVTNIFALALMRDKTTNMAMRLAQDEGKEYNVLLNGLTIIDNIKANGVEMNFFMKWAGYHSKVLALKQERDLLLLKAKLLPNLFAGFYGAIIMTFGGFSIMNGAMTVGMYVAFWHLMNDFQKPIKNLFEILPIIQSTEMQMQRLNDVKSFETDRINYPIKPPNDISKSRLAGELDLIEVSFGYNPSEAPLIENFNLHLEPGHSVALVGASGSGKSTLAKIIMGLYEENSGKILLDGVERHKIPRAVRLNSLVSVDQDTYQITGTIRQNISLFDDSLKQSSIIKAAKDACIHDDILRLNGGYEAYITENGRNFSGGECQRLEIARALAKNPSLLVLDEATSALDPITEKNILDNIRHRGCSLVIITHRLSTIRDCDEIIVLDRGKIIERGKHKDLIIENGAYSEMIMTKLGRSGKEAVKKSAIHLPTSMV